MAFLSLFKRIKCHINHRQVSPVEFAMQQYTRKIVNLNSVTSHALSAQNKLQTRYFKFLIETRSNT